MRAQGRSRQSIVLSDRPCLTDAEVHVALLGNEIGLLEGALVRSRERVRSFKQERKGQRELIGQTLQMALAGCQGRVLELESELHFVRQDAAERIAQLEQELTRDKRVRASDLNKEDDGTLSIGSLGSGKPGLSLRTHGLSPGQNKRAGSESRRITELENELQAMHVKVDVQQKEIESLRAGAASASAEAESGNPARLSGVPLKDIESARARVRICALPNTALVVALSGCRVGEEEVKEGQGSASWDVQCAAAPPTSLLPPRADAIRVQQEEYKAMIEELEGHVRLLESRLVLTQSELGSKEGMIAAVEHEAGAARSQLLETEAVLARKNGDVVQLTSQLQLCILELKTLSEKSREAHGKQRTAFDGVRSGLGSRAPSFQHSLELERRTGAGAPTPTALAADT